METPRLSHSLSAATFDRTDMVPYHEGLNVLPHDFMFHRIFYLANNHGNTTAVHDPYSGYQKSYRELFLDIVRTKNHIRNHLTAESMRMLRDEEEVSMLIVSRGYEFTVAFFAVLALGAVAVPQSPHISSKELLHAAVTAQAHATICSPEHVKLANGIAEETEMRKDYLTISLEGCFNDDTSILSTQSMVFSSNKPMDQSKPALVIFTSGSTGPPKGVAYRRSNLTLIACQQIWKNSIKEGFTVLQTLPTHHGTGLILNTIPTIMGGGCIEFTHPKFDAGRTWERISQGGITSLSAVPTIFVRLLKYWDDTLSKCDEGERKVYLDALCTIEQYHCGSAALPVHAAKKWKELTGRHILERYGGTEFGNPFLNLTTTPFGSVGVKNPGVETYLEHGDHGEVFVRSPFMFSKYINDIEDAKNALTQDGYFRTGDEAEKVNNMYFLKCRKSVDIIKSGGYKISALDIERAILDHPKVEDVIVVGLDDDDMGQRLAAAVVLKEGQTSLSLPELRHDLKDKLSYYKLPTVLRIVPALEQTASFKVPKALLKKTLFGTDQSEIQSMPGKGEAKAKAKL
ncbi:uncharacterized protein Z520_09677 [Fonsecaea multimorphosa CBS 102226]|uniref:AMP-dependent synthetase/ligase domain-containing protein n=1 Tax=Fonsecaea multimorphosa CBS 102226 TaxID=1442371 RepID=A0A0D2IBV6_9EURO|nr:uncharacterized protein Z520_09677 [Fonsecaea multimorphosa CBS 102226]KIX94631.1 hypothetical protein Z520_09677 [Fonsecaea multimorphosa CBS 102226]